MRLVGYADRLSVAPGETIAFRVSCKRPTYQADVVQLVHGDTNPAGPGLKVRKLASDVSGQYPGKYQPLRPGSYIRVPLDRQLDLSSGFSLHLWIRATTPDKPLQTLICSGSTDEGFALRLDQGTLTLQLGQHPVTVMLDRPVIEQAWYSVSVVVDAHRREAHLSAHAEELTATRLSAGATFPLRGGRCVSGLELLMGAELLHADGSQDAGNFYNGRIEAPTLYGRALCESEITALRSGGSLTPEGLLAAWDFSRDISSTHITDSSAAARHGYTVNRPARAVTGHTWDGSEMAWKSAPSHYGAIHLHEDDLDDAGWEQSLMWTVPEGTPSAIYALHVQADDAEDYIPFAVRPKRGVAASRIVFLMPTFSYLAYANSRMPGRAEVAAYAQMTGAPARAPWPSTPHDRYVCDHRLNSLYDTHSDGSGCLYASWRRPLLSMRPKYLAEIMGVRVPHQLNADLHLIDWLIEQGYAFDVVTDADLHLEGTGLLRPYRVVLTGTHPEYASRQMIRACQEYLHQGGRMMYLGGNGMYWATQLDPVTGHTLEMRRTQPSSPHFYDPHPGELHLSTSGERAALWRHGGLPSQAWLGVVTSGAGRTGQHYVRRQESFERGVAWMFAGIGRNELIGNFRNLHGGYGAAAGEVDRVDLRMEGTPHHTKILASSAPFDNTWSWDPVDPPNPPRADLALLEYPRDGAVFAASSIAWCSCLSHGGYRNNVARLTRNVLEGFLHRTALLAED